MKQRERKSKGKRDEWWLVVGGGSLQKKNKGRVRGKDAEQCLIKQQEKERKRNRDHWGTNR